MPIDVAGDVREFMNDSGDFGQAITVTDPDGTSASLTGYAREIGQTLEPDTGQLVAGSRASVDLPMADVLAAFGAVLPVHVADGSGPPWVVAFDDAVGVTRTYKVNGTMPDYRLGVVTCMLEIYKP